MTTSEDIERTSGNGMPSPEDQRDALVLILCLIFAAVIVGLVMVGMTI